MKPVSLIGLQKAALDVSIRGPLLVKGGAGSGKTLVAMKRAELYQDYLNRSGKQGKVGIITYTGELVRYMQKELGAKLDSIRVQTFHECARLFLYKYGIEVKKEKEQKVTQVEIVGVLKKCRREELENLGLDFFHNEFEWIKGQCLGVYNTYINAPRKGLKGRLTKDEKEKLWEVYEAYLMWQNENSRFDYDDHALLCLKVMEEHPEYVRPFTHLVVDEAQDFTKAQLLVLSKFVSEGAEVGKACITILADEGQGIYRRAFTWKDVELNIAGARSFKLEKNYRNTISIAKAANCLRPDKEQISGAPDLFRPQEGDKPKVLLLPSQDSMQRCILAIVRKLKVQDPQICASILCKNNKVGNRISRDLQERGIYNITKTMYKAKGLEFDAVLIAEANDGIIPRSYSLEDEEEMQAECNLFYVAMTRARSQLYILAYGEPSRFIGEIDPALLDIRDYRQIGEVNFDEIL